MADFYAQAGYGNARRAQLEADMGGFLARQDFRESEEDCVQIRLQSDSADWQEASRAVLSVRKTAKKKRNGAAENPVCLCSSGALNSLKKWLRSNLAAAEEGDVFAVTNILPHYCVSAGHMERAKLHSLPHWDLASLLEFKRWANRQLASRWGASGADRGGRFAVQRFYDSAVIRHERFYGNRLEKLEKASEI